MLYMASRRAVPLLPKYRWLEKNTKQAGPFSPSDIGLAARALRKPSCLAGHFGISENGALGRCPQRVGLQSHFGRETGGPAQLVLETAPLGAQLTDQSRPAVEHRKDLVRSLRRKGHNCPGGTKIAEPPQLGEVFGCAPDRHWQGL